MVSKTVTAWQPVAPDPRVQAEVGLTPLVVDLERLEVLHVEPVGPGGEAEAVAPLVYKLEASAGEDSNWLMVQHKANRQVSAKRSTAPAAGLSSTAGLQLSIDRELLLRSVLEQTLGAYQALERTHAQRLSVDQVLRELGDALREKADAVAPSAEEGWQALLEQGLRHKTKLLKSSQFKSTAQVSALLELGEAAIRRRIREHKLFALRSPADGELRIPVWALDPAIAGPMTATLISDSAAWDEWALYTFLSTPHGNLNGLKPFECLLSRANLTAAQAAARQVLSEALALAQGAPLLEAVRQALAQELAESRPA